MMVLSVYKRFPLGSNQPHLRNIVPSCILQRFQNADPRNQQLRIGPRPRLLTVSISSRMVKLYSGTHLCSQSP